MAVLCMCVDVWLCVPILLCGLIHGVCVCVCARAHSGGLAKVCARHIVQQCCPVSCFNPSPPTHTHTHTNPPPPPLQLHLQGSCGRLTEASTHMLLMRLADYCSAPSTRTPPIPPPLHLRPLWSRVSLSYRLTQGP
ncbi:unnamed protein product [Gadus morhua 'NCC']